MNPLTQDQVVAILPNSAPVAAQFIDALNAVMTQSSINTPLRMAAFLAQTGHESTQFTRLVENLNYSAQALVATWPSHFTPALAAQVAHQPEQIANIAYASRMGNGDVSSCDGWSFIGRGLIDITGHDEYLACGIAMGVSLIESPALLEQPYEAVMSAAWYWTTNNLNVLADLGNNRDIGSIINTGHRGSIPIGDVDRTALYQKALQVLGA